MTQRELRIDPMDAADWDSVRHIYREGIATRNATFETDAPDYNSWNAGHIKSCRFVARDGERVVGWAALSPVSRRAAYRGVAEVSVYVSTSAQGKGIGRLLLQSLIDGSEREGMWTLQAGIFPENIASIELHRRCGFREVGRRERIGKLDGVWRDVILMERRSAS